MAATCRKWLQISTETLRWSFVTFENYEMDWCENGVPCLRLTRFTAHSFDHLAIRMIPTSPRAQFSPGTSPLLQWSLLLITPQPLLNRLIGFLHNCSTSKLSRDAPGSIYSPEQAPPLIQTKIPCSQTAQFEGWDCSSRRGFVNYKGERVCPPRGPSPIFPATMRRGWGLDHWTWTWFGNGCDVFQGTTFRW